MSGRLRRSIPTTRARQGGGLEACEPPKSLTGSLDHDPETWEPVFGKRSCSNEKRDHDPVDRIMVWREPALSGADFRGRVTGPLHARTARFLVLADAVPPAIRESPHEVGAGAGLRTLGEGGHHFVHKLAAPLAGQVARVLGGL